MKTRKHHNNKGLRQIKNGRTQRDAEYFNRKYAAPKVILDKLKLLAETREKVKKRKEREMSVMICKECEKQIDTDVEDFDFEQGLCVDCSVKKEPCVDVSGHTKGKLQRVVNGENEFLYYTEKDGEKICLAAIHRPNKKEIDVMDNVVSRWNSHDELQAKADSHDDLLETLKEAETAILDAMHAGNLSRSYGNCVIEKIEQAIARAEK
jgi:hypothetical protein